MHGAGVLKLCICLDRHGGGLNELRPSQDGVESVATRTPWSLHLVYQVPAPVCGQQRFGPGVVSWHNFQEVSFIRRMTVCQLKSVDVRQGAIWRAMLSIITIKISLQLMSSDCGYVLEQARQSLEALRRPVTSEIHTVQLRLSRWRSLNLHNAAFSGSNATFLGSSSRSWTHGSFL